MYQTWTSVLGTSKILVQFFLTLSYAMRIQLKVSNFVLSLTESQALKKSYDPKVINTNGFQTFHKNILATRCGNKHMTIYQPTYDTKSKYKTICYSCLDDDSFIQNKVIMPTKQ